MRCTIYAQISGLAQKANVISASPQWGSNSKVTTESGAFDGSKVSVPAMVDVNSAVHCLRIDICVSAIKPHNQASQNALSG